MRWIARVLITSIVSVGIAFGLSYLPQLDRLSGSKQNEMTVFRSSKMVQLRDDNLVDSMLELPLHLQIGKVDWDHSILTIDLKAPMTEINPAKILEDMYAITHFGLAETVNVKQVLIRVMDYDQAELTLHRQLLLAVDARRGSLSAEAQQLLKEHKISLNQYLDSQFTTTYTQEWRRRFDDGL